MVLNKVVSIISCCLSQEIEGGSEVRLLPEV